MSTDILVKRVIKNLDNLFQNLMENYDTVINVGDESNYKTFYAHSLILTSQSTYFRIALSSDWIKKDGDKAIFEKPNISPKSFEIILRHLYSGTVVLNELTPLELLDLLSATDEFMLPELMSYAESHLLSLADSWIKTDFIKVHLHSNRFTECKTLQEFCIQKMCENPELIFKSNDFIDLSEQILIDLLKRDDLEMEEIEIWRYVVKWGIHKCSNNLSGKNLSEWNEENYNELWEILKDYIELIRFSDISREDLFNEVYSLMFPIDWGVIVTVQPRLPRRGKQRIIDFDEISKISRELKSEYIFFQNDYILTKFNVNSIRKYV